MVIGSVNTSISFLTASLVLLFTSLAVSSFVAAKPVALFLSSAVLTNTARIASLTFWASISPRIGRLFLLLMTLDNADKLAESAVLDTVNLIIYKNIKCDRR